MPPPPVVPRPGSRLVTLSSDRAYSLRWSAQQRERGDGMEDIADQRREIDNDMQNIANIMRLLRIAVGQQGGGEVVMIHERGSQQVNVNFNNPRS